MCYYLLSKKAFLYIFLSSLNVVHLLNKGILACIRHSSICVGGLCFFCVCVFLLSKKACRDLFWYLFIDFANWYLSVASSSNEDFLLTSLIHHEMLAFIGYSL